MLSVLVARRYQVKDSPSLLQKTLLKEKPRTHMGSGKRRKGTENEGKEKRMTVFKFSIALAL
jgi:hypothetical protein